MNKRQSILYLSGEESSDDEVVEQQPVANDNETQNENEILPDCQVEEPVLEKKIPKSRPPRGSYALRYKCKYCKKEYVKIDTYSRHENFLCPVLKQKKEKEAELILKENERILERAKRTEYLKMRRAEREAKRPVVEKVVEKIVKPRGAKIKPKVVEKVVEIDEPDAPEPVVQKPTPVVQKPTPVVQKPTPVPSQKPQLIFKFC